MFRINMQSLKKYLDQPSLWHLPLDDLEQFLAVPCPAEAEVVQGGGAVEVGDQGREGDLEGAVSPIGGYLYSMREEIVKGKKERILKPTFPDSEMSARWTGASHAFEGGFLPAGRFHAMSSNLYCICL